MRGPGIFELISRANPSSGWMRIDNTVGSRVPAGSALKRIGGTSLNSIEISLARFGSRLPVRRKNGMPAQRQSSMNSFSATKVSVCDFGSTPGSCR